ncbi:hypothetical protein C2G38_2160596, partial [Gigaspora rosea]
LFLKLFDIAESDIENESGIENKSDIEDESDIKSGSDIEDESDIKSVSDIKNEIIVENKNKNRIRKQFLESDEISKNLPMVTEKINNIYTSKPFNVTEISVKLSKIYISKTASDIEVLDDI